MKKVLKGTIISDKMQKNVVVDVSRSVKHPMYGKNMTVSKNYKARNTIGALLGETVLIQESKPFAKDVKWEVISKE
jgi:small subunit ribosomal protein S17